MGRIHSDASHPLKLDKRQQAVPLSDLAATVPLSARGISGAMMHLRCLVHRLTCHWKKSDLAPQAARYLLRLPPVGFPSFTSGAGVGVRLPIICSGDVFPGTLEAKGLGSLDLL